jgi:hypothetical protein
MKRAATNVNAIRTRRAAVRENSFDPETGTFTVIAATGTPVTRHDFFFDEPHKEILSMRPGAIRLDRLASGRAPLLDSHRTGSMKDQIGVITRGRIEGNNLVADVQLSDREDVKPIAADIAAGIIRNVSVGYIVHDKTDTGAGTSNRVITMTDWEPVELSLVTIPADANAHIRSHHQETTKMRKPMRVARKRPAEIDDEHQDDELLTRAGEIDSDEHDDSEPANDDGGEGARISKSAKIRAFELAAQHKVPGEVVTRAIANGATTLKEIRGLIHSEVARRSSEQPRQRVHHHMSDTFDDADFLSRTIGEALYARMTGTEPKGAAIEWRARSLLDMGAALIEVRGERVSWRSRNALAERILSRAGGPHSTSDFPTLLLGTGNRVLMEAFQAAQSPLVTLARRRDAADFRTLTVAKIGNLEALKEVGEGGEVTHGTRAEAKEAYRVRQFVKMFGLSRTAIINDDLGAFADMHTAMARSAAETEAREMVALLTANSGVGATLDDGHPLYYAPRGNYTTPGTALSVESLDIGRTALRGMKNLDGSTLISVTPKFLLVGPERETKAEQVLASLSAATVEEVNPFSGKLSLMVEPRLSGNAWRLFADPSEVACLSYSYLNGESGPILEEREGWNTLGIEFRTLLDFGCGVTEYRGTYLNAGE